MLGCRSSDSSSDRREFDRIVQQSDYHFKELYTISQETSSVLIDVQKKLNKIYNTSHDLSVNFTFKSLTAESCNDVQAGKNHADTFKNNDINSQGDRPVTIIPGDNQVAWSDIVRSNLNTNENAKINKITTQFNTTNKSQMIPRIEEQNLNFHNTYTNRRQEIIGTALNVPLKAKHKLSIRKVFLSRLSPETVGRNQGISEFKNN